MIKNEKGITLVALVIMVIVIAILATVATYTGINTYKEMQVTSFVKRLETVEEKVKSLMKRAEVDSVLKSELESSYGVALSEKYDNPSNALNMLNAKDSSSNYRYFSNSDLADDLKLKDIEGDYIINFKTGEVYSVEGVRYKAKGEDEKRVHSISEVRQ